MTYAPCEFFHPTIMAELLIDVPIPIPTHPLAAECIVIRMFPFPSGSPKIQSRLGIHLLVASPTPDITGAIGEGVGSAEVVVGSDFLLKKFTAPRLPNFSCIEKEEVGESIVRGGFEEYAKI